MDSMRSVPTSPLDAEMMLTDATWGRSDVNEDLRNKLTKYYLQTNEKGEQVVTKESLWGLLNFYTRDMRLANLSTWDNELILCRYMIDLAGDYLQVGMIEPFLICLSRAATILETSQSKSGFLRRMMNTLRQESVNQNLEPPKKGFFGGAKKDGGGY